ncbi:MAG: hypothetical protein IPN76_32890 [Saprospiraceae bacterium]|nr:hypothetical protein [Saprospiraceae bacterium]
MTVFTRRFFFLWTCLQASISHSFAETQPPPVLTNPSACGLNLFITEAGCGPANEFQINVATAPGTSLGGNLYLKELRFVVEHGWAADLDIFLKSPAGVMVEISTDNGDAFDNYGDPSDNTCSQFTTLLRMQWSTPATCRVSWTAMPLLSARICPKAISAISTMAAHPLAFGRW